jgi:mannosyltransferase OCH1-like enzyme
VNGEPNDSLWGFRCRFFAEYSRSSVVSSCFFSDLYTLYCRSTYKDWFTADIRQILVKTHGAPYYTGGSKWHSQMLAADFFDALTTQHYAMFSKSANVHDGGESLEFGYVKLHPGFWKKDGKYFSVDRQATLQLRNLPEVFAPVNPTAPFKIPRRLIFVSETLLWKTEDPMESFFNHKLTIDRYKEAWNDPFLPVWYLDILTCSAAIFKVKKELVPVFRAETNVSKKIDMCRVAALYLSGGYQIDIDLEVRSPPLPLDDVGLLVAREGDIISKRFIATEQKCGVIETALNKMVDLSQQKQTRPDFDLVVEALTLALTLARNPGSSVQAVFVPLETIGGDISAPWIVTDPPAYSFDNPVPLEMRGRPSPEYKIPRRLIFTYKHNLLETKDPPLLYENVKKTIQTYREAWGDPAAPVWFLNDTDCRSAIYAAKPNLLTYFDREVHGSWKADICRVAALYLTGGYYFDADMEAVNPWMHDSNVAFATVDEPSKRRFFQSFLASEPKGRVLEEALDEMLVFYENKTTRKGVFLGPYTLKCAFESVPTFERGETVILQEMELELKESDTPLRPNAVGCCCNFAVQGPAANVTFFYSRIVGGGGKCMPRDSHEGQVFLAEEAFLKKKKM